MVTARYARLTGVAGLSGVPGIPESSGRSRPGEEGFPLFLTKTSTTIRGKTYTHYKVVESVRDEGRVKHRVLWSLGALTEDQAEQIRGILAVTRGTDWVSVPFTDIAVTQHAAYLDVAVGHAFWDAGEWSQFWGADAFWVETLVLNRLVDPQAKIHLHAWVASTALPAYYGVNPHDLDPYAVYRVLDRMANREGEVQQWLAAHLPTTPSQDAPTFFYDLPSTYVGGTTSPLAKPGYSRDHRPDRTQIVIGLLITAAGDPVYWQVWPGNTPDVTTVQTVVTDLQKRLKLGPCILVFDRGMVSAANLAAIEAAHHTYLSAVDRDALVHVPGWGAWPETIPADHWQPVLAQRGLVAYDADANLWYREWAEPGHRWVLAFDYQRGCLERAVQARAMAAVESWVHQKKADLTTARRSRQDGPLRRALDDLLRRKHLQGIVQYTLTPRTLPARRPVPSWTITLTIDEAARRAAQRVFGVTCFQTNAPEPLLSTEAIIGWYRRKNRVEEAFHEIKSPLALRPLFVSRSERIRAHVMTCVLAYGLYNAMEERLRQHHRTESPETVLRELASSQMNRLRIQSTGQTRITLTEPAPVQRRYLTDLECEQVVAPSTVQSVIQAMQSWL